MTSVFLRFLNLSITASWLVLVVLLLRLCFKKAPRWITCALWGLVALRLVLPFSIESPISLLPTSQTVVSQDDASTSAPLLNTGVESLNKPLNEWLQGSNAPFMDEERPIAPEDNSVGVIMPDKTPENIITAPKSRMEQILHVAAPVWLVGIGLMLLYELFSVLRVRSRVMDAVLLRFNIWQSDRIASPFIFGLLRPRIYVPYGLEEPVLEQVLSHERAHLHRRDHWVKPIAFTLLAVYWYNPLLWVGYILLCRDIEVACDQRVLRHVEEEDKKQYAFALLQCGVERRSIAACPLAFGEVSIKQRIKAVMSYRKPLLWVIIASLVISTVAAVCLLTVPADEEVVLSSKEVTPVQERVYYGTDTDGYISQVGYAYLKEHAENADALTESGDIPLVLSNSKAEFDELIEAFKDSNQSGMEDYFTLSKYDDVYFKNKAVVWLFCPGYDEGDYTYTVNLEKTNKGLCYAVSLQYYNTMLYDPFPPFHQVLMLFEVERDMVEQTDQFSTRHEKAPILVPKDGELAYDTIGSADLDGDGEEESIRYYHKRDTFGGEYSLNGSFILVSKADGTPILREEADYFTYNQFYLLPQEEGPSQLLWVAAERDGGGESYGVLSLKDGVRTVVESYVGMEWWVDPLHKIPAYAHTLSGWLENAELLFELYDGAFCYKSELETPRYVPLSWMDEYRNNDEDTYEQILENYLAEILDTFYLVGEADLDGDGTREYLSVIRHWNEFGNCELYLVARDGNGKQVAAFLYDTEYVVTNYEELDFLYRIKTADGKDALKMVTLFTDGTCGMDDITLDGIREGSPAYMTPAEWLAYAEENQAEMLFYTEGTSVNLSDNNEGPFVNYTPSVSYSNYAELLDAVYGYELDVHIAFHDLNGDGQEELLVKKDGTELTVYSMDSSGTQLMVKHGFYTGTSRFCVTGDKDYPGLFYYCTGGGEDQCYYLTPDATQNGRFVLNSVWTVETGQEMPVKILTDSPKLYSLSQDAYQKNGELYFPIYFSRGLRIAVEGDYAEAEEMHSKYPDSVRDVGELQPETTDMILLDGQYYQSYTASNADIRYIFLSKEEYDMAAEWDWVPVGTSHVYSLDNLGKTDDGQQ